MVTQNRTFQRDKIDLLRLQRVHDLKEGLDRLKCFIGVKYMRIINKTEMGLDLMPTEKMSVIQSVDISNHFSKPLSLPKIGSP